MIKKEGRNIILAFGFAFLLLLISMSLTTATTQEINYPISNVGSDINAQFNVQVLKYEPFPVNPGDWFDMWVKVENIGQSDAKNAEFQLIPDFPFESNDSLIRDYGIIPGTLSAHQQMQAGESSIQSNQVVMKFRVKVTDNAPSGDNIIQLKLKSDKYSDFGTIVKLPINIAKNKADFDISVQSSGGYGTSFTITNTGEGDANSIVIKTSEGDWIFEGDHSASIGKLGSSDSTKFTIQGNPKTKSSEMIISYTDNTGVRREIRKSVTFQSLDKASSGMGDSSYIKWIFGLIGVFVGAIVLSLARVIHRKKRH